MASFPPDLSTVRDGVQPVAEPLRPRDPDRPKRGIALCLSGGGYRAMLFHLGALWRLNELGYLPRLARVSSVSGGSITAGVLGLGWTSLQFQNGVAANFDAGVVMPVREMARHTIDVGAVVRGAFLRGSASDRIVKAYDRHVFRGATLQDLPKFPIFVINATNVGSGALWRFSRPYMWDYKVGKVPKPRVPLAVAVAASSAFPPVLSPLTLNLDPAAFAPGTGDGLQAPPYTERAVLTDGGVYDNLGLETAWKKYRTVLVSDGGGRLSMDPGPKRNWLCHTRRVLDLIDSQVRALRKRQLIGSFKAPQGGPDPFWRSGTYWSVRSDVASYGPVPHGALPCPPNCVRPITAHPTRLQAVDEPRQMQLVNWGYAICDVAMRRWVEPAAPPPAGFPYPLTGLC